MAAKDLRVPYGRRIRLRDFSPGATPGYRSKDEAQERLSKGLSRLRELQGVLYAEHRWAVLIILQAMDAAGKDSTISHVMSGLNPQGCHVHSFKTPSSRELDHDFLWRVQPVLPERGSISVFNRSYYEEVLIVRVHPEFLEKQNLPWELVTPEIWKERFEDINCFEQHLARSGVVVLKFFLHVSKEVQRQRFLARLEEPHKHWKFTPSDVQERAYWGKYIRAYEDLLSKTSTKEAPWYVIPADHKWFTRLSVTNAIVERLEELDLSYPKLTKERKRELATARKLLGS
jgi:PPK2 family polyphosphate:nucleotide phosphotransferase